MSFENDKKSVEKDTYEWCLKHSKRLKTNDSHRKLNPSHERIMTQLPGELEHAVKYMCKKNLTVDDIANTFQYLRKRTNIGKYSPYKGNSFTDKQPFRVEKDKPRGNVAEVLNKKNSCTNCGPQDHYSNNYQKEKQKNIPLQKSKMKKFKQKILNLTPWEMPSGKTLMMAKTQ
ncbi:hypothetical protein O181_021726 [Austropuccinia psidii MF-1]|uniref:Uncharacterized protein n=1 Tax=Austropuccinia psidii MF-1 TaxID=1389203 RepID=A0A9Q3CBI7_9BASI|nr:hypothetical protein [Austropuccinia psidii MF-1]